MRILVSCVDVLIVLLYLLFLHRILVWPYLSIPFRNARNTLTEFVQIWQNMFRPGLERKDNKSSSTLAQYLCYCLLLRQNNMSSGVVVQPYRVLSFVVLTRPSHQMLHVILLYIRWPNRKLFFLNIYTFFLKKIFHNTVTAKILNPIKGTAEREVGGFCQHQFSCQ